MDPDSKHQYAQRSNEWNIEATKRFESYEELEKYINTEYNGTIDADVKELDIRQVGQTLTEFEKVLEDFPSAKQYFTGINVSDKGKAAFIPNGELVLSSKYYKKATIKLLGTGYHEAGHLLELAVIHKNNPLLSADEIYELYNNGNYAGDIVRRAYNRIRTGKTLNDMRREISDYALISKSETLADAIEDYYMNGFEASVLSRQIIKILQEELK